MNYIEANRQVQNLRSQGVEAVISMASVQRHVPGECFIDCHVGPALNFTVTVIRNNKGVHQNPYARGRNGQL